MTSLSPIAFDVLTTAGLSPSDDSYCDAVAPGQTVDPIKQLPERLRTGHWYCDLHHGLFLILLADGERALRAGNRKLAAYFIQTLTVYWLVHSLMEEEGMARALADGDLDADLAARHAQAHVSLTKWWNRTILTPFHAGDTPLETLADSMRDFLGFVVRHIEQLDQNTYGVHSTRSPRARSGDVAHLALCGIPLSPQMAGCDALLDALAPHMRANLGRQGGGTSAGPARPQRLTAWDRPLWTGGKGAMRDRYRAHLARCGGRQAA